MMKHNLLNLFFQPRWVAIFALISALLVVSGILIEDRPNGYALIIAGILLTLLTGWLAGLVWFQRRIEVARRESEEKFRNVFDEAFIGMAIASTEGRWLRVNPAFCEILGYSPAELTDLSCRDVTHPDDLKNDEHYERMLMGGKLRKFNYRKRFLHKTGRTVWAFISGALVYDKENKPIYYIAQIADITNEVEEHRQLEETESRLRAIVHGTVDSIILADIEGRIILFNPSAEKLFGYSESEVLNQPLAMLMPGRYRKAHTEGIKRLLEGGEPRVIGKTLELSGLKKTGEEFPLELSLSRGNNSFYCGVIRDISERKAMETRLIQSELRCKYGTLAESSNEAVILIDMKGTIILWNNVAERLFRYTEAEMLGKPVTFLFEDKLNPESLSRLAGNTLNLTAHRKDGETIPVEFTLSGWKTDIGNTLFYTAVIRSVSRARL